MTSVIRTSGSIVSVSIIIALLAYYYKGYTDNVLKARLQDVLSGLLRAEKKVQMTNPRRVAVGFGACMDGFVNATDLLVKLGAESAASIPHHYNSIQTVEELQQVFTYFFQHGAAGERFISNTTLFDLIIKYTHELDARWEIGGNAPVMANRFAKEGCDVLLGAKASKRVHDLLHDDVKAVGGGGGSGSHDDQSQIEDDLHILMEYKVGDEFGTYISPRANRFIVHSDRANPTINAVEDFSEALKTFGASLVVVGGLQMMDQFPFKKGERAKRLGALENVLSSIPKETKIHFEMASFSEQSLLEDLVKTVVPYSDSLGMNEQELPNLYSVLTNGSITLISDAYPRVATVLDHTRAVYKILRQTIKEENGKRKVNRIHVHTLAYQVILVTKGSNWFNTMSAAAKASLTANRHVCGSNYIHTNKAKIIMDDSFSTTRDSNGQRIPFKSDKPVACWEENDYEVCLAPNLVCTEVYQTAGGGDNISSAGLAMQL